MRVNRQPQIGDRKLIEPPASRSLAFWAARPFRGFSRCSIDPPAVFGNQDRQFFHHELGLADGTNHSGAGRGVPFLRHALAGVAAPALDISMTGESTAINFSQVVFVQPRFTSAVYVVAVVEHETGAVR